MTSKEALSILYKGIAPNPTANNQCIELCKKALEKQIPKKPYKIREHKQNDYYCAICKRYLGDEMELKHACLQPEYCEHCGQALDWSDTE